MGAVDIQSGRWEAWEERWILPPSLITWGKDGDAGTLREKEEGEGTRERRKEGWEGK